LKRFEKSLYNSAQALSLSPYSPRSCYKYSAPAGLFADVAADPIGFDAETTRRWLPLHFALFASLRETKINPTSGKILLDKGFDIILYWGQ
jgi:hypothetical protein